MVIQGIESKKLLLNGINKTADVVKSTFGAKGKTVMIVDNLRMSFNITKDGVTVAKNVTLEDEIENYGCSFIKNAAIKTVNEAGDGTTTTSILTQSLCNNVEQEIQSGSNVHDIQEDIKNDLITVKEYIKNKSKKIKDLNEINQIATISSNNDNEIGNMIEEIYSKIGFDGVINTVETDNLDTDYKIVDGYIVDNTGYAHNMFINNFDKGTVEYDNPNIYIINSKISNFNSLIPILNETIDPLKDDFKPTVIICHDIDEAPLKLVLESVASGKVKQLCIVTSNLIFQDRKNKFLDICAVVDTNYSEDSFSNKGSCERLVIEKENITIINGKGDKELYLKKLKKEKVENNNELNNRIFRLENKAAIIRVGGKLPQEISEKKDRIEDAVLAVKSAIEEGYCAGGATTYIFAVKECNLKSKSLKKALLSPYEQLLINANIEPYYLLNDIHNKGYGYGYDVKNDLIINLYEKGIIDSSKVLRVALENSIHTCLNFMFINSIILP